MGQSPQQIKQRNERAREELASDIHALSDKLNVKKQVGHKTDAMVDNLKGKLGMKTHHNGNGASSNSEAGAILATIKEHPVAALALGYGAKTILSGWKHKHDHHIHHANGFYTSQDAGFTQGGAAAPNVGGQTHGVKDKLTGAVGGAKDSVVDQAGSVKDKATDVGETVALAAMEARDTVTHKVSGVGSAVADHASSVGSTVASGASTAVHAVGDVVPTSTSELNLAVRSNTTIWGLGAIALGALIGWAGPRTRFENEKLGDVRDTFVDAVQEKAIEAKDAVQSGVDQGLSTAKETVKDELSTDAPSESNQRPGTITGNRPKQTSAATSDSGPHITI